MGASVELKDALTPAHLTATTGGMRKQGGIKSCQEILNTIFTDLSKKKSVQGKHWF